METFLAVISDNIWMKIFEEKINTENEMSLGEAKTSQQKCPIRPVRPIRPIRWKSKAEKWE